MKRIFQALVLFMIPVLLPAKGQVIERVDPPSWFTGMKNDALQLMVYGREIGSYDVKTDYPGVDVSTLVRTENPNYLFVNLNISDEAVPGIVTLTFTHGRQKLTHSYPLLARPDGPARGFNSSDVIYLLMPDRFANGDTSNDNVAGMTEQADRSKPGGRHGGDLKGIEDHLDYLHMLGVTGIWLNPFLENNQQHSSYHGYSTTDFYKSDPRYGSNDEFKNLVTEAHKRGMKVVMDMIFNHTGSFHWWMKDLPSKDWIHQFDEFTRTNYRASTYMDPYAAESDRMLMEKGWFDVTMPDLNQSNPLVETYLIQTSLWWIAFSDLDGIRMDTYPYPQPDMMSRWAKRVTDEFPGFFIVGEVWYDDPAQISYWAYNKKNSDGYRSNLPSVTDFPVCFATHRAFEGKTNPTDGLSKIYNALSQDYLYPEPLRNVIFLDNHDMTRFYTQTGKSLEAYKLGLSFIMTTRGIPQLYYGTEIVMEGDKSLGDGRLRDDFPGGWPGDARNVFTGTGLTEQEKEALDFTTLILNWRKNKEVIHTGKLKHYIPSDGVYVYFRYDCSESVMVIINANSKENRAISGEKYAGSLEGFTSGTDIISGRKIDDLKSFTIAPQTAMIIELK
ncbi:MAG TPA: glycoside hydrolase family 13 protein [Bacteroidales bacterium]|nr:glycoside hydrolase family 13 protein [Bacteroidales bacterium]HNX82871.1 glycoside hydrolase family 13 protein [Bacteroidales bacterium]HOC49241.1 glycoside hydrolase family 13 protein [Bacteroidales bacterium]